MHHVNGLAGSKDQFYYVPASFKEVVKLYNIGESKISNLTQTCMNRSISFVKANFIAAEIVEYEEKTSAHMPLKQREALSDVGDYVHNSYHELARRYGFSTIEAKMAYDEGSRLALDYQKLFNRVSVSATRLNQIQKETKQAYEFHQKQNTNTNIKSDNKSKTAVFHR